MKKTFKTSGYIIFANSLILVLGFIALMFLNQNQLKQIAIDQNADSMKTFSSVIEKTVSDSHSKDFDTIVKNLAAENINFRISIIDSKGVVIADSDTPDISQIENHLEREEVLSALSGHEATAIRTSTIGGNDELYFATPFTLDGKNFALRLSAPIDSNKYFSGNYLLKMIFGTALILLFILFLSIIISSQVIIGIDELKNAAHHYQKGEFAFESNVKSPRELAELSETMNSMAETIGRNVYRLKELEQVRKDFVANVSHELKTPITSIKGFSETLLDGAIDDTQTARNFIGIIKTQSDRLENIIEDLLTLSKLENDDSEIEFEDCDVIEFVENICEEYKQLAAKKQTAVNFSSAVENCVKQISPNLFHQGLANILDNAVKYCPENSIVNVSIEPIVTPSNVEGSSAKIKIAIEDNGSGIPAKYRSRIFERFFRVDKGRSRDTGGTGLGLSITKHIVELHSGTIKCLAAKNNSSGARFEIVM